MFENSIVLSLIFLDNGESFADVAFWWCFLCLNQFSTTGLFFWKRLFSPHKYKRSQTLAVVEDVLGLWTCTLCNRQPLACTLGSAPAWFNPPNSSKNTHWRVAFQTKNHGQLEVFQWGWQMKQSPSHLYFSLCRQAAIKNENKNKIPWAPKVRVSTSSHRVQWSKARRLNSGGT